MEITKQHNKNI